MLEKFFKYGFVQILAYGIELLVFYLVISLCSECLVTANILAKSSAAIFAFGSHKYFTFGCKDSDKIAGQAIRYSLLLVMNTFAATYLLVLLTSETNLLPILAKILSDVVIIFITFLLTYFLVFNKKNSS